ncbi:MAG: hypothetical protein IT353_00320 [Gemmatimonadaceae bacterium]|nr:hypothetical protein [Gemmatimonadaceae bacterium]
MRVSRAALGGALLVLVVINVALLYQGQRYRTETARLKAGMTSVERARAEAIIEADSNRSALLVQVARRQSSGDDAVHLAVSSESSFVALDRGTVRLRRMSARFGPERRVGVPPDTVWVASPRGLRTVERQLGAKDRFELPAWVWGDRRLPVPSERAGTGWLGAHALVLSGGAVIYSLPAEGPLADSSYVMPGAVRVAPADLAAIRDNLTGGVRVYFY